MEDIIPLEQEDLVALRSLPIRIDGCDYADAMFSAWVFSHSREKGVAGDLARFLMDWQSPRKGVRIRTSGSTGTPREMTFEKVRMAQSARRTVAFLGLRRHDRALLAMPLAYVAARMVVVRALVAGLDLVPVEPSLTPFRDVGGVVDFAALTPMQAWECLNDEVCAPRIRAVRCLLLGGGAVSAELVRRMEDMPGAVWSSYGMTETLSHVALRRLNGPGASESYTPLPGVSVSLSRRGTLVIDAPAVCASPLETNDVCEIAPDGTFRILGRIDNVVCSGGIKVQVEEVERRLSRHLGEDLCVTAVPDDRLGERLVLLLPGTCGMSDEDVARICAESLERHWKPRRILRVEALPRTETGKVARARAKELARSLVGETPAGS